VYLGLLGFGDLVPSSFPLPLKLLFLLPLACWFLAFYLCLLLPTRQRSFPPNAPEEIRQVHEHLLARRQQLLMAMFVVMAVGQVSAGALVFYRFSA
jgi:hypothetical protein